MNSNRHKYFRWTPRTAWFSFTFVVVIPTIVGYMAYKTDVSFAYTSMVIWFLLLTRGLTLLGWIAGVGYAREEERGRDCRALGGRARSECIVHIHGRIEEENTNHVAHGDLISQV
jgi:hypothetical protein